MNIQELYDALLLLDQGATLHDAPRKPHSYRGWYERLAFEAGHDTSTVGQFRELLTSCLGGTFTGYKGGEYTMHKDTLVHLANYSQTGQEIVGLAVKEDGVYILTEED